MYHKVEALVVRRTDLRENDRIITFYSRESGRVQAVARGVRKRGSKRAALFEPFRVLDVVLRESKRGSLYSISDISSLKEYVHLCSNLERLSVGFHVLSMLSRLTPSGQPEPQLYRLAIKTLELLDNPETEPTGEMLRFELRFLEISGLFPEVWMCCECGRNPDRGDNSFFISPLLGGVVCQACARRQASTIRVNSRMLRWFRGNDDETIPAGLQDVIDSLFRFHYQKQYRPPPELAAGL